MTKDDVIGWGRITLRQFRRYTNRNYPYTEDVLWNLGIAVAQHAGWRPWRQLTEEELKEAKMKGCRTYARETSLRANKQDKREIPASAFAAAWVGPSGPDVISPSSESWFDRQLLGESLEDELADAFEADAFRSAYRRLFADVPLTPQMERLIETFANPQVTSMTDAAKLLGVSRQAAWSTLNFLRRRLGDATLEQLLDE